VSDGWATGAGIFEPAPPAPEPIAPHGRRRVTASPHVVRCPCGVELIYPGAAPAGARCTTCETKETTTRCPRPS
jgi:hypothetical protein